jgi:hypothetical protein
LLRIGILRKKKEEEEWQEANDLIFAFVKNTDGEKTTLA